MKDFVVHTGIVAPLDRANVDTDAIIPKQFLKSIKRSGFGPNLFDAWRYLDRGDDKQDAADQDLADREREHRRDHHHDGDDLVAVSLKQRARH